MMEDTRKSAAARELDEKAEQAVSLAEAQALAERADRLRGSQARVPARRGPDIPLLRN